MHSAVATVRVHEVHEGNHPGAVTVGLATSGGQCDGNNSAADPTFEAAVSRDAASPALSVYTINRGILRPGLALKLHHKATAATEVVAW